MKRLLFVGAILLGLSACKKDNNCESDLNPDCICPAVFDPVCGCDDVTYGNSCEAECAGITDYTEGACD